MTFRQAAQTIIRQRKQAVQAGEILFMEALSQNPALLEVETAIRKLSLQEAKGEAVDQSTAAMLTQKRTELLTAMGLPQSLLSPAPHCQKCGDTAHTDKGYCDCVRAYALSDKRNIEIPCKDFLQIDFERFDAAHRSRNRAIYAEIQTICEKYPANKRRTITVLGGTGTGKTLLAGCAANLMQNRGFAVAAITAFGFVNRVLKYHTTFDDEKLGHLEPLLESDFLVIDDLGTESILKNVTLEYLLNIVNERIGTGKLTMITTNLSPDGILARYGERLYSRLFDKSLGYVNILNGRDMRTAE